jgi:hypothetical protein
MSLLYQNRPRRRNHTGQSAEHIYVSSSIDWYRSHVILRPWSKSIAPPRHTPHPPAYLVTHTRATRLSRLQRASHAPLTHARHARPRSPTRSCALVRLRTAVERAYSSSSPSLRENDIESNISSSSSSLSRTSGAGDARARLLGRLPRGTTSGCSWWNERHVCLRVWPR